MRAPRGTRFRIAFCVVLAASLVNRPAELESVRWWRSPALVKSLVLSESQLQAIERLYEETLPARTRCIERLVATTNRANLLIREGGYSVHSLRQTEEMARGAAEERALSVMLNDAVVAVLSPAQQRMLAQLRRERVLE